MNTIELLRGPADADQGTPPAAPPAADPPPATDTPPDGAPETGAPAAERPWYERDAVSDAQRSVLTAKGLTIEDPAEAAARLSEMLGNAEKLIGGDPKKLMSQPDDPKDYAKWARDNATRLGLPDSADKYTLEGVNVPEGYERDEQLEQAMQQIAFDEGVTPAAYEKLVAGYAQHLGQIGDKVEAELSAANAKLKEDLASEWGDQYGAKVTLAQQGAAAVFEKAGMDDNAQFAVTQALKDKVGDAGIVKLFATIGDMMGDDNLVIGKSTAMGMTPAEARAKLSALQAPGGEYFEATAKGDRANIARLQPQIDQLTKVAAQS